MSHLVGRAWRAVVDTNVLVSALIRPRGALGRLLASLRDGHFLLLVSPPILEELVAVLGRPPLVRKYGLDQATCETLLRLVVLRSELVRPRAAIRRCRDPKDDMFLEAAIDGSADRIVTGDSDLLTLESVETIPIVRPADFVREIEARRR